MSPNFSWLNLITNALNLASNEPDNPDIILQFMSQLTGQRLVRVDSNDGDVPSNVGRVHSNNVDVPSNVGRVDSNNGDVLSNGDLPKHQSNSCCTTPGGTSSQFDKKFTLTESGDGMNEKEDDSSFHSPSGGNNVVGSLGLHDNADSVRFPQGNLPPYVVDDPKFRLSWTMMTYGCRTNKKNKVEYQCCMGIYKCPREGCNFVQSAVAPRKGRVNGAKPTNAKGTGVCSEHNLQLTHVPCSATCTVFRCSSSVTIHHKGKHEHARPSEKVSKESLARLENMVKINNNAKPIQILQGTPTREAAAEIHPGLNNLDRLAYYMKNLKKKQYQLQLTDLSAWEETMGAQFWKRADLKDGIFIIQFPGMIKIAKSNTLYAFQTDTIENFVHELNHKWNVTVTSTHSEILGRHVPVLISVTKQRHGIEYMHHFLELFECLGCKTFVEFKIKFPGNISDFSSAEQSGFTMALKQYYKDLEINGVVSIEGLYKFCRVSFFPLDFIFLVVVVVCIYSVDHSYPLYL